jgi:predicted MPP superfamily phosphohydrolase
MIANTATPLSLTSSTEVAPEPSVEALFTDFSSGAATAGLGAGLQMPALDIIERVHHEADYLALELPATKQHARQSFRERVLQFIEGPWAPDPMDLPRKRSPEESGNTSEPFRTQPRDAAAAKARKEVVAGVYRSERKTRISPWTSLFEYDMPLRPEHRELSGMTILHLSDVHLLEKSSKPTRELNHIATFLEAKGVRTDLVVLSGDLITVSPRDLNDSAAEALRRITERAQYSFFVLGNHDYHGHTPERIGKWVSDVGFVELTNKSAELRYKGTRVVVNGIDDAYFGSPLAPDSLREEDFNLTITHNNDAIRSNHPSPVDLMLAGHTHCGELKFFNGVRLMRAWGYCDDVNQHTRGWAMLTERTLSFVHPGLARHYVPYPILRQPPGVVLHHLRAID